MHEHENTSLHGGYGSRSPIYIFCSWLVSDLVFPGPPGFHRGPPSRHTTLLHCSYGKVQWVGVECGLALSFVIPLAMTQPCVLICGMYGVSAWQSYLHVRI